MPTTSPPSPDLQDPGAVPADAQRAAGGVRTGAGSTYGDFVPRATPAGMADPSRGAEMERDVEPADAHFDRAPQVTPMFDTRRAEALSTGLANESDARDGVGAEREARIREAAFRRFQQRGSDDTGDAVSDWLAAEAEIDGTANRRGLDTDLIGAPGARDRNARDRG